MNSITDDKASLIVLYGSSESSMDALTAAEKLRSEGYGQVSILKGGMASWRSLGYPLEGEFVDMAGNPETHLTLRDGTYHMDTDNSIIEWFGRNPTTKHFGTVRISGGQIQIEDKAIKGVAEIDMNSIDNTNLEGNELKPVLLSHLKSDDFFLVKVFPTAKFIINRGTPAENPYLSSPNCEIDGTLDLRGVKANLSFPATLTRTDDNGLLAEAHFDIDRTRWNIIYGSTRFFENLGMHLVFDLISFQVKILAKT
jgi:polyisoprenoid-binding protein YceI